MIPTQIERIADLPALQPNQLFWCANSANHPDAEEAERACTAIFGQPSGLYEYQGKHKINGKPWLVWYFVVPHRSA